MSKKSSRASQKAQVTAAQQRLAELKAEQARKETRHKVLLFGTTAVLVLGVTGSVGFVLANHKSKADVTQATPDTIDDTSGVDGVKAWKTEPSGQTGTAGAIQATHIGSSSVKYFTYPPVGGPHDPTWLTCGEYDKTPRWENAVHDMEHGAVIITYKPDLAADQIQRLKDFVKNAPTAVATVTDPSSGKSQSADTKLKYLDLFPYSGQTSPIVLSAWGHQLDVPDASDSRIQKFVDAFRVKQGITPEIGASCAGGTGTPVAGTT